MQRKTSNTSRKRSKRSLKDMLKDRIPKTYPWKILQKLSQDLHRSAGNLNVKEAEQAIRHKDIASYVAFCKGVGSLNSYSYRTDISLRKIRAIRLLTSFQKFNFADSPFNQKENARTAFMKYERRCARTNRRLSRWLRQASDDNFSPNTYESIYLFPRLERMRDSIYRILGDSPDLSRMVGLNRHGPGACTGVKYTDAIPISKFIPPIGTTEDARSFLLACISSDPIWVRCILDSTINDDDSGTCCTIPGFHHARDSRRLFPSDIGNPSLHLRYIADLLCDYVPMIETINESKITFVPKNAETFRTIEPQPAGNIFLQLGLGALISDSLLRIGIDLRTQEKNQRLASRGSSDDLVTIDLSGASDCQALSLLYLFPYRWRNVISTLRCKQGIIDGDEPELIVFEKISAMGNGFTFPLETLIFVAAIEAILPEYNLTLSECIDDIAVYGDDIIVPQFMCHELIVFLAQLGFSTNNQKTFVNGLVRESCGHDFYNGKRIDRPTFKTQPMFGWELMRDYNLLYEKQEDYDLDLSGTLSYIKGLMPEEFRDEGPRIEDKTSWFFVKCPTGISQFYNEDFQCNMLKLHRTSLLPKESKKDKGKSEYYYPLLYYSRNTDVFSSVTLEHQSGPWKFWKFRQFGPKTKPNWVKYGKEHHFVFVPSTSTDLQFHYMKDSIVVKRTITSIPVTG